VPAATPPSTTAASASQPPVGTTAEILAARYGPRYKWTALINTTVGVLMVTLNGSILLIALPAIFDGIKLDPLQPQNTSYLLWLITGFLVVTAVLVVSFGRIGDMFGRVRMYNLGFAIFTVFSILLSLTWLTGPAGAWWLIIMRILQGVGGAFLFANSSAIVTDAFPQEQRGLALGINSIAAITGSFIGLIVGGLLAPVNWRLIFLVSVPFGLVGTIWGYLSLKDTGVRQKVKLDWWGNVTFAVGLIAVLVGITYGIQPYGGHTMGWTNPWVLSAIFGGIALLIAFVVIEHRVEDPMFQLKLFKIRAFSAGNAASLLSALGRGGLQFILIIWLQGIWLPLHGYNFADTPLWAGIYMLPLTVGFLTSAPLSGYLSDRFGARPFASGGMLLAALSFVLLLMLPVDFTYWEFALILALNGFGMGLFTSPNRAGIMNSLPAKERGVGAGMAATFQNSATVLSIGIFFSLMITGLAATLGSALTNGLAAQGVPAATAQHAGSLPPVATLFASLLGFSPVQQLLGNSIHTLPAAKVDYLTGREFFPHLISAPFHNGLQVAFIFAALTCLVAAGASWLRGGKYVYSDEPSGATGAHQTASAVAHHEPHLVLADAAAMAPAAGASSIAPEDEPGGIDRS
jgi:MFS family permease